MNIIWILSIIGLTISVGPCCYKVCEPILIQLRILLNGCILSIKECLIYLIQKVLIPLIDLLNKSGLIELSMYWLCFQLLTEGVKL